MLSLTVHVAHVVDPRSNTIDIFIDGVPRDRSFREHFKQKKGGKRRRIGYLKSGFLYIGIRFR